MTKAIDCAIDKASQTIRHLGVRGDPGPRHQSVENGAVAQYQVTIKAGFRLEDS